MNLNHLAIFRAVAEAGSVSGGADALFISQPAVSKQLRQFERSLGLALFDRVHTGVRLTAAGEMLLAYARRLFAVEADAARALDDLKGLRRGRLAVGASMTIGVYLLPRLLAAFQKRHPEMELHCEIGNTAQIAGRLLDSSLDIALLEGPADDAALQARPFLTDHLLPIIASDGPLAGKRRLTAGAFLRQPLLLREQGSGTREVIERAFVQRGFALAPAFTLASTEAIKHAVAAGLGVAIVSALSIREELAAGRLLAPVLPALTFRRALHHVEAVGRHASPAVLAFRTLLEAFSFPSHAGGEKA